LSSRRATQATLAPAAANAFAVATPMPVELPTTIAWNKI
jgi:hypothetical protein